LLVQDVRAYSDSAFRMAEFAAAWGTQLALGAHIEMDVNGKMYPGGASFHPEERALPLAFTPKEMSTLRSALNDFNGFYSRERDYAVVNPVHNLVALAAGVILGITLLVWALRRFWFSRRQARRRSTEPA
jgi:hypothetical protein